MAADASSQSPIRRSSRAYPALLIAAVLGPVLLLVVAAAWDWQHVRREADHALQRTLDLLHEEVLRDLVTDALVLTRVDDRVAAMSWPDIIAQERPLHQFLKTIVSEVPEIEGLSIIDANGEPQVVGRRFPAPVRTEGSPSSVNLADRDYFKAARAGQTIVIDGPFTSRLTGHSVFEVSRRLASSDGSFRGIVSIFVSPVHLTEFWRSVIAPGDVVNLVNGDGALILRYPPIPTQAAGGTRYVEPIIRERGVSSGVFERKASAIDGIGRRLGYTKIGEFPVYLVYGVDRRNVLRAWYPTVVAFAGLCTLASIALLFLAGTVVRRARGEAAALQRAEAAARALGDSEARYRAMYEKTPAPMHVCDIDGNIVTVSARWLEMLGYRRDEVIGRNIADFHSATSAARLRAGGWRHAIAVGGVRDVERQYRRKNGELLDVLISGLVERDAEGRFLRVLAVTTDVTQQRRAEAAFRQAQKMEAVGQLTGGIAHDFNNLLTVIIGNLDALQRRFAGPIADGAEFTRMTAAIGRAANRAAILTQRLLAFSRRQPLEPKALNLNRLVTSMSDLLRSTLGESVAIETILAGGLWWCAADANQLESALLNLAVNARDAMPGGGKLTIETANTHLDEAYAATHEEVVAGQYVMLAVSDTGIGMAKEVIARAVEPFFTTKDVGQGTGLGLSQVYGFVKQSGGHLKIYSEAGQGTTVRLYLPRLVGEQVPTELPSPAAEAVAGDMRATILVVEDDDDVRSHSVEILRELGYRALEAADGAAALRRLETEPEVALLFTDVGLPGGINGRELADEARRRRPALKVLFTTGYARNAIVHQDRLDPGVELIVKPFSYAALAAKIREVLGE